MGPASFMGSIDELRLVGSSVLLSFGRSVGSSVGSSVGLSVRSSAELSAGSSVGLSVESMVRSSVESSVGLSMGSSMGSSAGSSEGSYVSSLVRLQDKSCDSKRIEKPRAAAAVVVAAGSCQVTLGTEAKGVLGMSVGSLVGSVRLGSLVSILLESARSAVLSVGSMGRSVGSTVVSVSFIGSTDKMRFAGNR